jgi:SAM-dependent methyltransferase
MRLPSFDPRAILNWTAGYRVFAKHIGFRRFDIYVREHVRCREGDRILDIGCGTAHVLDFLPNVDYVGVDAYEPYLKAARRRYGNHGKFLQAIIGNDPLEFEQKVDLAMGNGILHHVNNKRVERLLHLAKEALKPNGRLVTVDPCYTDGQSRAERFLISTDRGMYVRQHEEYLALASAVFPKVIAIVRRDLLGIRGVPWSNTILECFAEKTS